MQCNPFHLHLTPIPSPPISIPFVNANSPNPPIQSVYLVPFNLPPPLQRMRLGIKNPLIQTHALGIIKYQIQILQRLSQPKTLLLIILVPPPRSQDVPDGGIAVRGAGHRGDRLEGLPGSVLVFWIACQAVGVEEGFDGFYCEKSGKGVDAHACERGVSRGGNVSSKGNWRSGVGEVPGLNL